MLDSAASAAADYEIFKTMFTVILIIYCMYSALGLTGYNISLDYISTPGNVTLNEDNKSQTLTYIVNKVTYTHYIAYTENRNKEGVVINKVPALNNGPCTVYYPRKNPNSYQINHNPVWITTICSGVLCLFACLSIAYYFVIRSNRGVAGVMGGLSIVNSLIDR